eukprot:2255338-Lingulodinium_polyedra.AAC.1
MAHRRGLQAVFRRQAIASCGGRRPLGPVAHARVACPRPATPRKSSLSRTHQSNARGIARSSSKTSRSIAL